MLKISNIVEDYDLGVRGHKGKVIVFVRSERPLLKGDIVGDLLWRRKHEKPLSEQEVLEAVKDELEKRKISVKRIEYNRKAGCSMCPCSPGYVIYDQEPCYLSRRTAIYLEG